MIRRFLDCSSGHLSPETWSWLDTNLPENVLRDPANGVTASLAGGRTRYGWFVYASEDQDDAMPEDLRQSLFGAAHAVRSLRRDLDGF